MKLISLSDVQTKIGFGDRSIKRMIHDGSFPTPVQVGPRKMCFFESEIDAWIASRPRGKFDQPTHLATSNAEASLEARKQRRDARTIQGINNNEKHRQALLNRLPANSIQEQL